MSERDTRNRKNSFTIENNLSSLEVWAAVTSRAGCNSDSLLFSFLLKKAKKGSAQRCCRCFEKKIVSGIQN